MSTQLFDSQFGRQLSDMYAGIESTMKAESTHSCALLLSAYTEVLGGLVTGHLKINGHSRENYTAFLPYLGMHYLDLQERFNIYRIVRSKFVHQFSPNPSYVVWLFDSLTTKSGLEITSGTLNFNLREYYRDFRNAIQQYRSQFLSSSMTILNFMRCMQIDFSNIIHRESSSNRTTN